jgi:hypothetical protein
MTTANPRNPEDVIVQALRESGNNYASTVDRITRELKLAGFEIRDTLEPAVTGEELTEGAGPDDVCGCGEPITMYDGYWLHIYNPELRGTDDHDAQP